MSLDFSISSLSPIAPLDLSTAANGASEATRIKQVSKAMEGLFVSQLTEEMGKGIGSTSESKEEGGLYSDFIHQAMTQGVTQGGGFGLAKVIEDYLTHRNETIKPHLELKTNNRSYHAARAD